MKNLWACAALVLPALSQAQDCTAVAANVVENCGLNSMADVDAWDHLAANNPRFDSGGGVFGAGAFLADSDIFDRVQVGRCVQVNPNVAYAAGGWLRNLTPATSVECRFEIFFFTQAGCAGGGTVVDLDLEPVGASYEYKEGTAMSAADAVSARMGLVCFGSTNFMFNLDEGSFRPYVLLIDGFE